MFSLLIIPRHALSQYSPTGTKRRDVGNATPARRCLFEWWILWFQRIKPDRLLTTLLLIGG
jgi:hypothetical protein